MLTATVDPGAANFSWWDPKTNAIKGDNIFGVSHEHLAYFLLLSKANGIQYSVVIREPGHVRISVAMHRMGLMEGTILFKLNLGDHALWGMNAFGYHLTSLLLHRTRHRRKITDIFNT